jgi:hypothetical protein
VDDPEVEPETGDRGQVTVVEAMESSRTQLAIAVGAGGLLLFVFLSGLIWLSRQGPVLSRSEERDSLSGIPNSITLNPLRDRSSEVAATKFIRAMRDGQCRQELAKWEKDYRKQYAVFLCDSEARHPLVSWRLADWEDAPPLRILNYRGARRHGPGRETYEELFSVTLEKRDAEWVVTKYDAMY